MLIQIDLLNGRLAHTDHLGVPKVTSKLAIGGDGYKLTCGGSTGVSGGLEVLNVRRRPRRLR